MLRAIGQTLEKALIAALWLLFKGLGLMRKITGY